MVAMTVNMIGQLARYILRNGETRSMVRCVKTLGAIIIMNAASPLRTTGKKSKKSAVRNDPNLVFETPDGHLFLKGDTNRTQDQHLGLLQMTPDRVDEWRALMTHRANWIRDAGIEFAFMIGPDKQSVFWPQIGNGVPDHRNSLLVFRDLAGVPWVDPVPALAAAPKEPPVFPFNDSHYDAWGAYIAYRELFAALPSHRNKRLEFGQHFDLRTVEGAGDLGNKLSPYRMGKHARIGRIRMSARLIYNNGVAGNGGFRIHFNPKVDSGIGVLCGDSYSQNIVPFIAEHFRVLVHLRSPIDEGLIRSIRPSSVIGMVAERFMLQPPVHPDDVPSELMFIKKLADGEIKPADLTRSKTPLGRDDLPGPIMAAVARHDALGATLTGENAEALEKFSGEIFDAATPADVVVAAYLAWAQQRDLAPGWRRAYDTMPFEVRANFEAKCPA